MVGRSAYSVVNEQGKIRSDRTGAAKSRTCGDSPFLNREYSIRARLAEAGIGDFLDEFTDGCFSDFNWTSSYNRAENVTNAEPIMHHRAGYWDDSSGSRIYLFTRRGLQEATKGHDFNRVLKALDDAGAFVKTGANARTDNELDAPASFTWTRKATSQALTSCYSGW
jgi:hypothetical protein